MKTNFLLILLLITASFALAQEKEATIKLAPGMTWEELQTKCVEHKVDSVYLLAALRMTIEQRNADHIAWVGNYYMDCLKNPLVKNNIEIIGELINHGQEKSPRAINFFLDNARLIDKVIKEATPGASGVYASYAEWRLAPIIYSSDIEPLLGKKKSFNWNNVKVDLLAKYPMLSDQFIEYEETIVEGYIAGAMRTYIYETDISFPKNWTIILAQFKKAYPEYNKLDRLFLERKTKYYELKKMWPECADAAYTYLTLYGAELNYLDVNNAVWKWIFLHSSDKKKLTASIKWLEQWVLPVAPNYGPALDTYANLLYKLGRKQEALLWSNRSIEAEKIAIEQSNLKRAKQGRPLNTVSDHLRDYQTNLDRMQKDLPTWPSGGID